MLCKWIVTLIGKIPRNRPVSCKINYIFILGLEALLPSYCDRHDSGTCDFLERLEKFGQENNVKLYDIMTFDNITKIKSLLDDAILYKK